MKVTSYVVSLLVLFFANQSFAQSHFGSETNESDHISTKTTIHHQEEENFKRHKLAIYMGYTYIPQAIPTHEGLLVPTFGLDYTFRISEKWAVGLINDIEIAQYMVEVKNGSGHEDHGHLEALEREYAYVGSLVVFYSPWEGWNIGAGPGIEIERNKNLFVGKFIFEKEFKLHDGWELSPNFQYDIKEKLYDTWTFGVSIGKRF
ncbi:hypothetical protein [Flammeovirga sp. SJP92]|uniref:hypothetical protein n=1 Tax=Flammeovirga sp. SJP92 TaxID=1775430 RepID=UPI00078715D8|nr:hypothetical protein [Flammeovirga sp. SJP92]KXX70199.1 hypothetical protein AVL50_15150 [Flammeovirga sp. SJP92]